MAALLENINTLLLHVILAVTEYTKITQLKDICVSYIGTNIALGVHCLRTLHGLYLQIKVNQTILLDLSNQPGITLCSLRSTWSPFIR